MLNLFSPLALGNTRLPNRIALNALPSGFAQLDGFFGAELARYYRRRARSGAGLIVIESACVLPPPDGATPHVGLYADAQIPALRSTLEDIHASGASALVMLDQPLWMAGLSAGSLREIGDAFVAAAWRARAAGAHGVMLSTADGGPFEQLLSPLRNRRADEYGSDAAGRMRLLGDVVESIARWSGGDFVVGVRLNVEEFTPGGLALRDARAIAPRLVSAGAQLIEISAETASDTPIARFPGWQVPLAAGVKALVDVPVIVGGLLDDPELADSVVREGSADLVAVGERLRVEPEWPYHAWAMLLPRDAGEQQT
jgi:NADPH2 dehydrogenase